MMGAKNLGRAACLMLVAFACAAGWQGGRAGAAGAGKGGGRAKPRPVVYLALGDSTGVGVGAAAGGYAARLHSRIESARPGSRLVNLCATGAATADLLNMQVELAGAARPTLVTIGVGANDLIRGVSAEQFARNFEEVVLRLRRQTDAPVVIMNIPDLSLAPAVPAYMRDSSRRHILVFNARIAEVAARHGLPVVDLFGRSPEFSSRPEYFSPDGLHPSDAGYDYWAGLLWPYAERALVAPPAPAAPAARPRGRRTAVSREGSR